ncbi:hypothetical protein AB7M15_000718 [Bradyrhizobium ottawaense]
MKSAGAGLRGELQALAPAHPRLALHHVDDAFEMAVMVCAGLGIGLDADGAGPQFLGADAREIDRGRAVHARRRRHVGIELVAGNDAHAVMFPAIVVIVVMVGMRMVMAGHGLAFCWFRARQTNPKPHSRAIPKSEPS